MFKILLQTIALVFFLPSSQSQDLLGPKPNLPQELNDFLNDVQRHKKDFAFIRNAVKNQKKYNKNYQEASGLLGQDVVSHLFLNIRNNNNFRHTKENEFNLDSDMVNKNTGEDNSFSDFFKEEGEQHHPYNEEDGTIYAEFEPSRFKKRYPNERYSRNIHSPIRLRRESEKDFRSKHKLDVNPNGQFRYRRTLEKKYPSKSHEKENHFTTVDKESAIKEKKREVEINITSNRKLIKQIKEDGYGPNSIVLNIKTNSALRPLEPFENSTLIKNNYPSSPENNENIPNIADNPPNHRNSASLNFLPAKNNLESSGTLSEVLPEVGTANKSHKAVMKSLNTILKWPGQNSRMTKSINMGQNNFTNFSSKKQGLEYDLNEDEKDNFEKMQNLEVDGTGVSHVNEKPVTRGNQGYDYFDAQNMISPKAVFTKNIVPATIPERATSKEQKTENILHLENTQCKTPEKERFKIITSKEDNEDSTTETINIGDEHNYNQRRTDHNKREKQKNFRVEHLASIRDRKHLPRVAKCQRKRVRQNPKKKVRLDHEADYYDLNLLYESPKKAFEYIPSYRRGLKEIDYDYNPHGIQDDVVKAYQDSQVVRKKFKTEEDYSEEEDMMTSNTLKKMPVKKTYNQFAMDNNEETTEENDDDYDYSALTDMDNGNDRNKFEPVVSDYSGEVEDEDVIFEEVDNDKLDIDEAAHHNNKSEHDIYENIRKLIEMTTERTRSGSVIKSFDDMLWEPDQVLSGAYSYRGGRTRKKNRKRKVGIKSQDQFNEIREKRAPAEEKLKRKKRKRKKRLKTKHSSAPSLGSEESRFHEKPLTDQEKQDIFFRFVQGDQKFHDMMQRRGLEDYQKYLRQDFVKREEPTSETAASASREAEAELIQVQSDESEDSSSATSSSFSNDEGADPASTSNDESTASSDSPNGESKTASSEAEASSNGTEETLPSQGASSEYSALTIDAVLVTAKSDIFGNVTVPELGTGQRGNGNNGNAAGGVVSTIEEFKLPEEAWISTKFEITEAASNSTKFEVTETASNSTEFQFSTTAEDLTQIKQSENMTQGQVKTFEEENAKHSPGTVTSVLPLAIEAATESLNLTKEEFLDLDDILVGMLPKDVVLESLSTARGRGSNGLKFATFNVNLVNFPLWTYNSSEESSVLLIEMSNLLKKLKYHNACQALPTNLQTYLKTITKNEMDDPMTKLKEMNEIDPDNQQSSYIFHFEQNDKIYERAQVLRDLLRKYQNLSPDGKKRVEPVKKYIDSHLAMIEEMGGNKTEEPTAPPFEKHSTTQPQEEKEISAVEADEEMKLQSKTKEEGTAFTSPQFGKLAKAVRNVRSGRQVIKRIEEIYGRNALDKSKEDLIANKDKGFESPRIINF